MHKSGGDQPMLHRNLTPATLLVKHDNSPILTGFDRARIPAENTISPATQEVDWDPTTAPEVQAQGLAVADVRSDVYSMCASLSTLFEGAQDHAASSALAQGMAEDPAARSTLSELNSALARLLGETLPAPPAPPVRFWTEEQVVPFEGRNYRIVSRLGSGSIGTTFKVVEIDPATGEDLGAYVAKAVHDEETAKRVMRAYSLVRSHLRHSGLSTIYQFATDWQDNGFSALMAWIEGEPLSEYAGLLSILAEDLQEPSTETLAVRWLRTACDALDTLHRSGLVHGDVSPRNIIVCGSDLVLTDYDCVTKVGERPASPGTVMYCSPSFAEGGTAMPSDDIYALAATFFHMWFETPPFQHDDTLAKERGLNWMGVDREAYPTFASFLDRATDPDPAKSYRTAADALADLRAPEPESADGPAVPLPSARTIPPDVEPASVHDSPMPMGETTDIGEVDGDAGLLDLNQEAEGDPTFDDILEETVESILANGDWTKDLILDAVIEEMGLLGGNGRPITRRMNWYKALARRRKKGIVEQLAAEYPQALVNWWWDGDEEEQNELLEQFFTMMDGEEKSHIAAVAREFNLFPSYAAAMAKSKRKLLDALRGLDGEMLAAWLEAGNKLRDRVVKEIEEYESENEAAPPPAPVKRTAGIPFRLLQINNIVSFGVDNDKLDREAAKKLGMEEIGPYWYFDCSTHRRMDAFVARLEDGEKDKHYDVPEQYWWPILHFQELLGKYKGSDAGLRMDKAQRADIRLFYQEKRRRSRNPKKLELMPTVYRKNTGTRVLYMMAWEHGQEQLMKHIAPGKFKTAYNSQTWEKEDGFWLKTFLNKREATAWLAKLAKDRNGTLADMGYKVSKSTAERMKSALAEIRVLRKKQDNTQLRKEHMDIPWEKV